MPVSPPTIVLIVANSNNAILSINNIAECKIPIEECESLPDIAVGHILSEYPINKVRIYLLITEDCAISEVNGMHKKYVMNGWSKILEEMKEYFYNNRKFFRIT